MTPTERMQAGALLAQAEALREQAAALHHIAEGMVRAANALLSAEPPSPEAVAAANKIFGGKDVEEEKPRHYGSVARKVREEAEAEEVKS